MSEENITSEEEPLDEQSQVRQEKLRALREKFRAAPQQMGRGGQAEEPDSGIPGESEGRGRRLQRLVQFLKERDGGEGGAVLGGRLAGRGLGSGRLGRQRLVGGGQSGGTLPGGAGMRSRRGEEGAAGEGEEPRFPRLREKLAARLRHQQGYGDRSARGAGPATDDAYKADLEREIRRLEKRVIDVEVELESTRHALNDRGKDSVDRS